MKGPQWGAGFDAADGFAAAGFSKIFSVGEKEAFTGTFWIQVAQPVEGLKAKVGHPDIIGVGKNQSNF